MLRNIKFFSDTDFLKRNWETLKFGFEHLMELDIDKDGVPEGNPEEVKNTFDNLVLFGADAYDTTTFLAGCQAMIRMAEMMKDNQAKKYYEACFEKADAVLEKLWRDKKNKSGRRMQYYITCYDPVTGKTNTDVWTNQLDALWYLIAIGEEPFIPAERAKQSSGRFTTITRPRWAGPCAGQGRRKSGSERGQAYLQRPIMYLHSFLNIMEWSRKASSYIRQWIRSSSSTPIP